MCNFRIVYYYPISYYCNTIHKVNFVVMYAQYKRKCNGLKFTSTLFIHMCIIWKLNKYVREVNAKIIIIPFS